MDKIITNILGIWFCLSFLIGIFTAIFFATYVDDSIIKNFKKLWEDLNLNIIGKIIYIIIIIPIAILAILCSILIIICRFIFTWHPRKKS